MKEKNNYGRKFFARVKSKDKIVPYDGDDEVFSDEEPSKTANVADTSDSGKDYVKSFVNIIKNKASKLQNNEPEKDTDEESEADEFDNQAEAAFDYFRGITKKIESLKKTVSDAVKNPGYAGAKSNEYEQNLTKSMDDVNERLDEINLLLNDRMQQLAANTGDIKNGVNELDETTKGSYDEISRGIMNVTKTTEENVGKITELSDTVRGVKERVNEIHTTTNSFDKLYDSVFEFKTSICNMKNELESVSKKQSSIFKTALILLIAALVLSAGAVTLGILALVL